MITWKEWKNTEIPPRDREYIGEETYTGLEDRSQDWTYARDFLDDFAYELQEAKNHDIGLLAWQEWCSLEYFFGQRLSYEDFVSLKEYYENNSEEVDGDILELQGEDPVITAFRKGDTVLFTDTDAGSCTAEETVTILRLLTSEEVDLFDVGPMYQVQRANGEVVSAFYDELSPCA